MLYSPRDVSLMPLVVVLFAAVVWKRTRALRFQSALLIASVAVGVSGSACVHADRAVPIAAVAEPGNPAMTSTPAVGPHRPRHKGGGDPSTGVYIREDDDLVLNTPMPIVLRRTYNSGDAHPRQFGMDTTHPGEWWIYGDSDPRVPWGELILADGGRIRFTRITPGDTQEGAVLRHDSTPTEFNGALLSWTGSLWEMRFRDGSLAFFLDCQQQHETCSLVERRDSAGHRLAYVRDSSGTLLRMESEGQYIAFDYDDHKRIVRAYDTLQHEVSYTYDDRGRLVRATGSDAVVRRYDYDDSDKMVGVREPGRILQNWFDDAGRWIRQVVKASEQDDDPYVATVQYVVEGGSIVQTDFDEGDGVNRRRYNSHHQIVSETFDADTALPIAFTFNRDATTNVIRDATMTCHGDAGVVTRPVPVSTYNDDDARLAVMRESCLPRR